VVRDDRGAIVNECSELSIPLETVQRLAVAVEEVLREAWSYLLRHPSQVERRYDHPNRTRWQLHHPPAFNWLLPRLQTALAYQPESALFEHTELYKSTPRLVRACENPTLEDFHPRYVQRLLAYQDGDLLWRGHWKVSEFEAWDDLQLLRALLWQPVQQKLLELVLTCLMLWMLKQRRRQSPSNFGAAPRYTDCCSLKHTVHHPGRGPPA
jgi:hypothetical protein